MKTLRFGPFSASIVARSQNPPLPDRVTALIGDEPTADGFVAREVPTGERKSRGILVGLFIVAVGLVCSWNIGFDLSSTEPYSDGQTLHGTVIAVERHWQSFKSKPPELACKVEVAFTLGRQAARASSAYSTMEQCPLMGQQVDVSVRGSDPGTARVIIDYGSSTGMWLGQLFVWFWIAIGAWLILHGLRDFRRRGAT